jgi:pectinesterase inhibitor-like protein
MSPSKPCIVAASALALLLALSSVVMATVVTTCKAAAAIDKSVNYDFCVLELSKHHDSPDADTWGLAKVATGVGAANAENAVADIKAKLDQPGMNGRTRSALGQCQKLYHDVDFAFLRAHDTINNRNYVAGKQELGLAVSLAHQCDDVFAKAATQSPLKQYSAYTEKIAAIGIAITNLI